MPEENDKPTWLETLTEGGLPQIIAGPAGKAISRLIGATVEIPAGWIDGVAQGIKDKNAAKSKITEAIGDKAAEMAVSDPHIMDRALSNFLGREYRAQTNKEEVAKIVLDELKADPPNNDGDGPSDDWMNKFERHAGDASSDDLRLMYAKLLAGEIREAGSVSPATLHFVSMLDGDTSRLIDRALSSVTMDGIAYPNIIAPPLSVFEITTLEQVGFWTPGKHNRITCGDSGTFVHILRENVGVYEECAKHRKINLDCALVSKAGQDLARTVHREFAVKDFANMLYQNGATRCVSGTPLPSAAGEQTLGNISEIPAPSP